MSRRVTGMPDMDDPNAFPLPKARATELDGQRIELIFQEGTVKRPYEGRVVVRIHGADEDGLYSVRLDMEEPPWEERPWPFQWLTRSFYLTEAATAAVHPHPSGEGLRLPCFEVPGV